MKFTCPHCNHTVEIGDSTGTGVIYCPKCRRPAAAPRSGQPLPRHPHRLARSFETEKKRGPGWGTILLALAALMMGFFYYAMFRWHESPGQAIKHLAAIFHRFGNHEQTAGPNVEPTPAPVAPTPPPPQLPTATPAPVASAAPAARPDPVAWLIAHKERWPKRVTLRQESQFPAVVDGKVVGSVKVPAGTVVELTGIDQQNVAVAYMGGTGTVPITVTDLAARGEAAMARAEREAKAAAELAAHPRPVLENIREAGPMEIASGLGALYTRRATTFRVFAPDAKSVSVVLYDEATGDKGRTVHELRRGMDNLWDTTVAGDLSGKFYTYLHQKTDADPAREVLDPYATNAVASSSRARITPLTSPVQRGPRLDSPTDMVIYEMHVRDFTVSSSSGVADSGLYTGWTEAGTHLADDDKIKTALDHLTELGVTHVQIMPVEDFENDENDPTYDWGYNTSAFFSPEGMFASNPNDDSRVRELKALITALHARGIGVIMDVVMNHTSANASLQAIAPEYYYRHMPDGSFANGSGCGNEVRSEAPMTRRLVIDSLKYWVQEYGVDGFRFDLMALMDKETIREAGRELKLINPDIVLYGEPWTGGATPLRDKTDKTALKQVPAGAFNDDFRNALKGRPDGGEPGWIEDGSKREALKAAMLVSNWFASPAQSINYMTCHDNLVLWDKLLLAMPDAGDDLRIETMKLGYLALLTSQGVPFIHGGEEFARSKGGDSNSYNSPDSVNAVDWELKQQHFNLFTYVRDVIALRKAHPLFRLRTRPQVESRVKFEETPDESTLMFTVSGGGVPGETWSRACVVMNSANEGETEITLPGGTWTVAFDENGAATDGRTLSGKINVRYKSGLVLYQR